jgi:hypothetical protein
MVQDSSIGYLLSGLKEGLRALIRETEAISEEETDLTVEDKKDELVVQCNKKECLDARMKINSARGKVLEACHRYKNLEGTRNVHAGAAIAAFVATLAFVYKLVLLGSIINLWMVAACIAITLAVNDSKSLITSQKELILLNEIYLNHLKDFKTTLNVVHDICEPECLLIIDTTIPTCS